MPLIPNPPPKAIQLRKRLAELSGEVGRIEKRIDGSLHEKQRFEVAGEDGALLTAMITAKRGGRVTVVGIPPSNQHSFPAGDVRRKGLTVAWSRRMKAIHMLRAIEMADHGIVSFDGMISATADRQSAAHSRSLTFSRNTTSSSSRNFLPIRQAEEV